MTTLTARPGLLPALLLAGGMAVTVGSALGFEHIGGYIPCALCLLQRQPYYYGIPVAILAALNAALGGPAWITRALLGLVGIMMVVGAGMGVYHSGVEWHFWEGPATCATSAYRHARSGLASAMGRKRTSAGTRNTELSTKAITASQISAEGRAASESVQS